MYEYKCVGAPEKAKRRRGARTRTDRVAHAMQELINGEAVDGWEYQRTDLLPVEEKSGLFSRPREAHRAVLVFRRTVGVTQRPGDLRAPMAVEPRERADPLIRLAADSDTPGTADPLAEQIKS